MSGEKMPAPYTTEPHVYRQPNRYVIHLVNYNHDEKATGRAVVEREAPIATLSQGKDWLHPQIEGMFGELYTKHYDTRGAGGETFISFLENFMGHAIREAYTAVIEHKALTARWGQRQMIAEIAKQNAENPKIK